MRTLWIVSGGTEAVPGIRRARELGLHVVVSDLDPDAPGFELAHDRIIASTYDVDATVSAARNYHQKVRALDGVMCCAADVPLTVAGVAAALGLPGISVESARLAADKLAMKRRFVERGIPVPWFAPVGGAGELRSIAAERGFPLVIKPVDSRGARGVLRLQPNVDLDWAFGQARQFSPSGQVMVEEYVPGPQISTESVLLDGTAGTPGFIDRNYEYLDRFAPYMIENGGHQPSALGPREREAVSRLAEAAGRAMGINRHVVKGDLVLSPDGPKVIEMAARLSGGWMSTDQIPLGTGVDLVGIAIRLALGETISPDELLPKHHRGVAIRYFFPEPGKVTAIANVDRFTGVDWVRRLTLFTQPGEELEPVTNHTRRAGLVITTGASRDEAVARAEEVVRAVKIQTVGN